MSDDMEQPGLRNIPGYLVHELLERDLVSATYLAERRSDGYPVFLQVIFDGFDDDAFDVEAFFDALERVNQIKHPVLPDLWDVGRTADVLYSVTGAVEGRSLASTLDTLGRLPVADTVSICSELADALDVLHAADVVHGAINPHTVWINDRTHAPSAPWVTLRGHGTTSLLSRGVSAEHQDGPPADVLYVAPEQLRREELTGRVDQYALACMVVHCLTGAPPFERTTVNALVGAHLFAAPRANDPRWAVLQPHVVDAVQRAMSKDPADRFALCGALATAIGGDARRSWTWMIQEALAAQVDATGLDADTHLDTAAHLDAEAPPDAGQRSGIAPSDPDAVDERTAAWPVSDAAVRRDLTVRSLADADWFPGTTAGSDTAERVAHPPAPRSRGARPRVGHTTTAPPDSTRPTVTTRPGAHPQTGRRPAVTARKDARPAAGAPRDGWPTVAPPAPPARHIGPRALRWLAVAGVTLLMVAIVAALLIRSGDDPAPAAQQRVQRAAAPPAANPVWQRDVAGQPVAALLDIDRVLVSGAGGAIIALDPATGRSRWDATVDGGVIELAALDGVLIARTADALHGFDERTGRRLWDTTGERSTVAPDAVAAGNAALYEVAVDDDRLLIRARAARDGVVQWAIGGLDGSEAATSAVYDRSRLGEQMLYVLNGSRLHAVDTVRQRQRWQTTLQRPDVGSLTATAKAIVVTSADGEICRYGMQDGDEVWTRCATLDSAPGPRAAIRTRNARVIVRSAHEVAAIDFTSGASHWSVTDDAGFADAFTANADMAFVAHMEGGVEAIDHQRGVERWRSGPIGQVTAMTAGADAVYVANSDGQVTRFDAMPRIPAP